MTELERSELIARLEEWLNESLEDFLENEQDEHFYALALEGDLTEGMLYLSLNSEAAYERDLLEYEEQAESVIEEAIRLDLAYNPGNWEYHNIAFFNLDDELDFTEERLRLNEEGPIFRDADADFESDDEINADYSGDGTDGSAVIDAPHYLTQVRTLIYEALLNASKGDTFAKIPKSEKFLFYALMNEDTPEEEYRRFNEFYLANSGGEAMIPSGELE